MKKQVDTVIPKGPEQYNEISAIYREILNKNLRRQHIDIPTFKHFASGLSGKTAIDLACGDGTFTRLLADAGAVKIYGVDGCNEMVKLAQEQPNNNKSNIEYLTYNVLNLPHLVDADLISAAFLLCYAKTREELLTMCKNISSNLKPGGKFFNIIPNPSNPLQRHPKYGTTTHAPEPLHEGDLITVFLFNEQLKCSFENYYWTCEAYEQTLQQAGFTDIQWHDMIVPSTDLNGIKHNFWDDFKQSPSLIVLECFKKDNSYPKIKLDL